MERRLVEAGMVLEGLGREKEEDGRAKGDGRGMVVDQMGEDEGNTD